VFSFGECELATFCYLDKNRDKYKLDIKYREQNAAESHTHTNKVNVAHADGKTRSVTPKVKQEMTT